MGRSGVRQRERVMAMIKGTTGNDRLVGTSTYDTINGDAGDDTIDGGAGNDKISGGAGNDVLFGSYGNDQLSGGGGSDTFVFSTFYGNPNGVDVITDFQVGLDVLHFAKPGWQTASMNDLTFSQVGGDTVISYGSAGEAITLTGVDLSQLMAHASHDFLFS